MIFRTSLLVFSVLCSTGYSLSVRAASDIGCSLKSQITVVGCLSAKKNKFLDASYILQCIDPATSMLSEKGTILLYLPTKNEQGEELQNIQAREIQIKQSDKGLIEFSLRTEDQDIVSNSSITPGLNTSNFLSVLDSANGTKINIPFICRTHEVMYPPVKLQIYRR